MAAGFRIGWQQVGSCVVMLAVTAMIASSYSVIAVPFDGEFHPSRTVLMLAMTVLSGSSALLSPLLGNLMDKISIRVMMGAGALCLVAGFLALSLTQSFTQVLIVYALLIAPANVLLGPLATTVLLSRWFVKRRGTAIGIAIAGIAVGGIVFPPVIGALIKGFEWRVGLRLLAVILALITLPAVALVVNRPSDKGRHPDGADIDPEAAQRRLDAPPTPVLTIISDPTFWMAALVFAIVTSGMKGMVTNLVQIAGGEGVKITAAAYLISIYSACGFVSKLGFAALADRINTRYLMVASLAGFAVGNALMVKAEAGYVLIATAVGLIGFFGGMMVAIQQFLIPRIFGPQVVGRAGGLLTFVVLLALLSTPVIFGAVFDLTGNYDAMFVVLAAIGAAALLIVPYIRMHPRGAVPAAAVLEPAE